jgi:hypothetical protein
MRRKASVDDSQYHQPKDRNSILRDILEIKKEMIEQIRNGRDSTSFRLRD